MTNNHFTPHNRSPVALFSALISHMMNNCKAHIGYSIFQYFYNSQYALKTHKCSVFACAFPQGLVLCK